MNRFSSRGNRLSGNPSLNDPEPLAISVQPVDIVVGNSNEQTGTTTMAVPAGLAAGDVLFVFSSRVSATCALPTGFTNGQNGNTNTVGFRWSYKVMGETPDEFIYGLTAAADNNAIWFRNVAPSVLDAASPARKTAASGDPSSSAITTTTNEALVLSVAFRSLVDTTPPPGPSGFTMVDTFASGSTTVNVAKFQNSSPGSVNPGAFGVSITSGGYVGVTIALSRSTAGSYSRYGSSVWSIREPAIEGRYRNSILAYDFKDPKSIHSAGKIRDLGPNGKHATIVGGCTQGPTGLTLNDSNGMLTLPLTKTDLGTNFSIKIWCTITSGSIGTILTLAATVGTGSPFIYLSRYTTSTIYLYTSAGYIITMPADSARPIMIVLTYYNNQWSLSVDTAYLTYSAPIGANTGPFAWLGNGYNGYLGITFHSVEITNSAMSETEVYKTYLREYRRYNIDYIPIRSWQDSSLQTYYIDSDNSSCYPGSGTAVYDLAGSFTTTLSDSAIYKYNANGSLFSLNSSGSGQYISSNLSKSDFGSTFTLTLVVSENFTAIGRTFLTVADSITASPAWLQLYSESTGNGYYYVYMNNTFAMLAPTNKYTWDVITITYDGTTWRNYSGGILRATYDAALGSTSGNNTYLGKGVYGDANVGINKMILRSGVVFNDLEVYTEAKALMALTPVSVT